MPVHPYESAKPAFCFWYVRQESRTCLALPQEWLSVLCSSPHVVLWL